MKEIRFSRIVLTVLAVSAFFINAQAQLEENDFLTENCVCNNDQSANGAGDGSFTETLVYTGPCGLTVLTGSGSSPASLAGLMFTESGPDPMTGLCDYSLTFNHTDGQGYDFCLFDQMGNPLTGSGSGMPICVSNVCTYPEINEPVFGPFCEDESGISDLAALVADVEGRPGMVSVTVDGMAATDFDPALLGPGNFNVMFTFTGSGTSDTGGTIANPAYPGCSTSYSLDVEIYDQPELIISACMCGIDPSTGASSSFVTYTGSGGADPYTVLTDYGNLTDSDLSAGESGALYLGPAGGSYTVTITDDNGCSSTLSSSCAACYFDYAITDPCVCNNDQSFNGSGDGTFDETIEITGPQGVDLIVGSGSMGLNGIPDGTSIPEVQPGIYRLSFDHTDQQGYTLFPEIRSGAFTAPALDAMGDPIIITNACQYPVITDPMVDMTDFCFNGTPLVFSGDEVTEINGYSGAVQVYVGGVTTGTLITEFDPSQYPNGIYELTFLFDGDFVNNMSSGGIPGFPGCQTSTSILVGVGGGETMACNDNVNVSVDLNCEVEFEWYSLIEDDYVPNIFDVEFRDAAGNLVHEDDLGSYAGSSLTYSIIDLCNNNSCWGTINIEDKSIPELVCDCPVGGEDGLGLPDSYSEDCIRNCYELPLIRNNYYNRLRDDIVQEDVGDFLDESVLSICGDVGPEDISFYDVIEDLDCGGALLRRTWVVSYDKGQGLAGTVNCTKEYYFAPLGLETADTARMNPLTGGFVASEDSLILPVEVVTLDCGADISPQSIAAFFDDPSTEDKDTDDDRLDPDELDIDLVIENHEGIPYAYPHYYMYGRNPAGPHAQPIDNEVCNILVAYTDNDVEACAPGCEGNRKVLRNWTILDWCEGEFISYAQVIKAIDREGPVISVNDRLVSVDPWKCSADVMLPVPEHLYDNCGGDVEYEIGFVSSALQVTGNPQEGYILHDAEIGTHRVEYVATDCCGNRTSVFINITVVDLTPPVPVTKEFVVVSLTNIGNPVDASQGIAKIFAKDFDNGSYDGCSDIELEVRRSEIVCTDQDTFWGDYVKFCCEDLNGQEFVEIDVQFRVTDEEGNVNYAWSTVRLEDKSVTIQTCPDDLVLTCDMDYNDLSLTGLPRVFGACGEIEVECDINDLIEDTEPRRKGPNDGYFNDPRYDGVEVPAYDPACGYGAVRRQFKSCSSCVQWFVIEPIDPFNPGTIEFPEDRVFTCDAEEAGEPSWESSVCNLIGVSLESDTFRNEDGACYKILNHWSVINWCNYDPTDPASAGRYDHTQIVKIIDNQDPVVFAADSLCFTVLDDCFGGEGEQLTARANDDGLCGSDWLKWELTLDLYADWTSDYFLSSQLPQFVNGEENPYYIAPTGNDELAIARIPVDIPSSKIWHRAVWRVSDGCGNSTQAIRYFQVTDKKAPTPYCLDLSSAVMDENGEVELWAIDFNAGSFDNCTGDEELIYTFTDVPPPPRDDSEYDSSSDLQWYNGTFWYYDAGTGSYEDRDDYGQNIHRWQPDLRSAARIFTIEEVDPSGHVNVPIYAWDACGNRDFCVVNLRLIDNNGSGSGSIAGRIYTETGEDVEQVQTELLSDHPGFPRYDLTDGTGRFSFDNIPMDADYQVSGERNDDYLNGVSTLDILLIQRHILGQDLLDSPYKMIAADINKDFDVSAIDLIELRKLILGIYEVLPSNSSWKAVDAKQNLTVDNPWIYRDFIEINNIAEDRHDVDFIGVKIGDVNGNASGHEAVPGDGGQSALRMRYEDRYVEAGQPVVLYLDNEENEVYGYQFALDCPGLEFVDIRGEDVHEYHTSLIDGKVKLSYNVPGVRPLSKGTVLTMEFKAKVDGYISNLIHIDHEILKAEAYTGQNLETRKIDMGTRVSEIEEYDFELFQNKPNPFNRFTEIAFTIPKQGKVELEITNMSGQMVYTKQIDAATGLNKIRLDRSMLGAGGMYYYTLRTGDESATRHMIMIE